MKQCDYAAKIEDFDIDLNQFDESQLYQIREGQKSGVDVSLYADPKFSWEQMGEIRLGLESGVDVSLYADPKYDWIQMYQIRKGLESKVDVSLYADPKFDMWQMAQIREGLESGVDVSLYVDPKIDWKQMKQILLGLISGLDVSIYAHLKFDWAQMAQIREGLESGVDISIYADPKFDHIQMGRIRKSLQSGSCPALAILTPKYAQSKINWMTVKEAARSAPDIAEVESEFGLISTESAAARKLGLEFSKNADNTISFYGVSGAEIVTITFQEHDSLVRDAIANSSTKSAFTKAFASRLKKVLGL